MSYDPADPVMQDFEEAKRLREPRETVARMMDALDADAARDRATRANRTFTFERSSGMHQISALMAMAASMGGIGFSPVYEGHVPGYPHRGAKRQPSPATMRRRKLAKRNQRRELELEFAIARTAARVGAFCSCHCPECAPQP